MSQQTGARRRRAQVTAAAGAVLLLAAACSSSGKASAASHPTTDAPVAEATATSTADSHSGESPATSITVTLDITDDNGWHYSVTSPVAPKPAFAKTVTSSPPGKAGVDVTYPSTDPITQTVGDDNPGRPGGPTLTVTADGIAYAKGGLDGSFNGCGPGGDGGLGSGTGYATAADESVPPYSMICDYPVGTYNPNGAGEFDEPAVDAFIARAPQLQADYRLNLSGSNGLQCSVIVTRTQVLADTSMGIGGPYCSSLKIKGSLSGA